MKSPNANNDATPETDPFWRAVDRILDHYLDEERRDYRSCSEASRRKHIYHDLTTIDRTAAELRRFDVPKLLARRREVAVVWSTEDVLGVRPHLTESQAWAVLGHCERIHDCNYGFTWDLLKTVADEMYPVPSVGGKRDAK